MVKIIAWVAFWIEPRLACFRDRRSFFSSAAGVVAAFQNDSIARAQAAAASVSGRPADAVARDEDFWFSVRHAFTVDRNIINLNNGGVSPSPKVVMDTEIRYLEIENMTPSYYCGASWIPVAKTRAGASRA